MGAPHYTTNPARIARLQENYDTGVEREKVIVAEREKLDMLILNVSKEKLRFLFQNALESYSPEMKNQKVKDYNKSHALHKSGRWKGIF
ncbi:hypothetical protein DQ04_04951040 [Trypanosoma grayi]|uniref:hypothetical protein n=1 Tax=Trypanosoma grayi TaxID=71804 RepID=UPI0004F4564D|nr:hypothetical protein DQ04_04951040 [Trypanosoma grayi]KEG09609.1 hypothetical protein DQ04_04951040 [Trypanosoma grayi]